MAPKNETLIVFIKHKGIAARVAENKEVLVTVTGEGGKSYTKRMDIGGFYIISPDEIPDAR